MNIANQILSDPINKWIFKSSDTEVFLVGGYLRDLLLGKSSMDKDYALKSNVRDTAVLFAAEFNGTFIDLKEKQTMRVVLKNGDVVDFNYLQSDILHDLKQRDYNLNAIAWSPETGIVDPLNGIEDINRKMIRAIDRSNLLDDPLRLLRAYRIAAQLGFEIDKDTRKIIKECSSEILRTAPERVTEEIFKLLSSDLSYKYLNICYEDKLLSMIFDLPKGSFQEYIHQIENFDRLLRGFRKYEYKGINRTSILKKLQIEVGQGLGIAGFMRLALLTLQIEGLSLDNCNLIRISNIIKNRLSDITKSYMLITGRISESKLFEIYSMAGDAVFEISLMLSMKKKRNMPRFIHKAKDYLKLENKCILSGHEIQDLLKILPGLRVGEIKREINKRKFIGLLKNKRDAKQWIISNLT